MKNEMPNEMKCFNRLLINRLLQRLHVEEEFKEFKLSHLHKMWFVASLKRLCGLVWLFELTSGEPTAGNLAPSSASTDCPLNFDGHIISIPSSHCRPYFHATSNLAQIVKHLGEDNTIILDVNSGYGASYYTMARHLGTGGTLVAIESSRPLFEILQRSAASTEYWSKTLLLHGDTSEASQVNGLTAIVNHVGLGCPHLLRFNHHEEVSRYAIYSSLVRAYAILEQCQPVLLIDCPGSDLAGSVATAELLHLMQPASGKRYQLYWYNLKTVWSTDPAGVDTSSGSETVNTAVLVALPEGHSGLQGLLGAGLLQPLQKKQAPETGSDHPLLVWGSIGKVVRGASGGGVLDPSTQSQSSDRPLHEHTQLTVHLQDTLATNTTIYKFLANQFPPRSRAGQLVWGLKEAGLDIVRVPFQYSAEVGDADTFRLVSSAHCFVWRHRVHTALTSERLDGNWEERWKAELTPLQTACIAFLNKRFLTAQRILAVQAARVRQDAQDRAVAAADVTIEGGSEDSVDSVDSHHSFYSSPSASEGQDASHSELVMKQWFERPPLLTKYDEQVCGEPLWCGHTLEFQRRIRAWQFPEEQTRPLPEHVPRDVQARRTLAAENASLSYARDWSLRENAADVGSCARSKFLVFEPPSYAHGIGSMLEMIAVAFRYAICLDRVLILNPYNQSHTITKWMHPGCQGSFAECFFEPVSGCALTEAEVLSAPVSEDGYKFELFPLREERVLVLKGMPMSGECTLCFSEWKPQSRFFDGLFIGQSNFDVSAPLLHIAAFRSAVKATWATQFLRYLLRPRPWLQEAISQLVHFSMRSPSDPLAADGSAEGLTAALPISSFPRRFLSLHVRFGMKAAEAALQPLSKYMEFINRKLPEVVDIFVSTETEQVIQTLIAEYPNYRFHYLHYPRREFLDLGLRNTQHPEDANTDWVDEMLYSLANLHVAAEASAFVGTLSSNWCMMIMQLERTRGDGGYEYFSMDKGSAFTSCF